MHVRIDRFNCKTVIGRQWGVCHSQVCCWRLSVFGLLWERMEFVSWTVWCWLTAPAVGVESLFWSNTMCCRWFLHLASGPAVYAVVFFLLSSLITLPALTAWSLAILCQDVGVISQAFPFLVADWKVWSPVVMEPAANYPYIFGIRLPSIWLTWRNPFCHPWCSILNLLAVLFCVGTL